MTIFTAVVVYLMIFWTVLFCVLPWGNAASEQPETGMAGSAPKNSRVKQKFYITAGVSVVLWIIIYGMIQLEIIDFHEIARGMVEEDRM